MVVESIIGSLLICCVVLAYQALKYAKQSGSLEADKEFLITLIKEELENMPDKMADDFEYFLKALEGNK